MSFRYFFQNGELACLFHSCVSVVLWPLIYLLIFCRCY